MGATAVGYSSSHPVMAGGAEDKEKSRRVVFRVGFSDAETLEGNPGSTAGTRCGRDADDRREEIRRARAPRRRSRG